MPHIYQIKITLLYAKPPIWRRLLVPSNITLAKFHKIVQIVMGWKDYHLHEFEVGGKRYGVPDPDLPVPSATGCIDEETVLLSEVLGEVGATANYLYDFGDEWEHTIVLEKISGAEMAVESPICTEGERSCPPEDVGGAPGYGDFLKAIGNPKNKNHKEMLEWIGPNFDPEAFSLEKVNRKLARLARSQKAPLKVN